MWQALIAFSAKVASVQVPAPDNVVRNVNLGEQLPFGNPCTRVPPPSLPYLNVAVLIHTEGHPGGQGATTTGGGGLRNTGEGGGGFTAQLVVPEKQRVQARDRALATVEDHLKVCHFVFPV